MAKTTGRSRCSTPSAPIKRRSIANCASSRSSRFPKAAPSTARPTTTPSRWTTWPIGWQKSSEASGRRYCHVKVGLKHPLFPTSDSVLFPRLDFSQTSKLDGVVSSNSPLDARPQASIILNDCNRPISDCRGLMPGTSALRPKPPFTHRRSRAREYLMPEPRRQFEAPGADFGLFGQREGRFDYLLAESTGILEPPPVAAPRLGRRTALTFPLVAPPQKNRSPPLDSSPDTNTPGGISIFSRTSPVRGSTRLKSLSLPSQVPCQSSPSTQVTPVTKRLDSMVRRIAPVWGSI